MRRIQHKQWISFLLIIGLICSLVVIPVYADDISSALDSESAIQFVETEIEAELAEETNIETLRSIQKRVDEILLQYGICEEMTDEEIANTIIIMDGETLRDSVEKIATIEKDGEKLTDEQLQSIDQDQLMLYSRFCSVLEMLTTPAAMAATVNVLGGKVSVTDTSGTGKEISGGVEITVSVTGGSLLSRSASNTITIQNISGSKAEISFNYSVVDEKSYTFSSSGTTEGAKHTVTLEDDASIRITLQVEAPRKTTKTAKLQLTSFAIREFSSENATVTVASNNNSLGNATVNGSSSATVASGQTVTLNAIPINSTFLGWINPENNSVVSTATNYTYTVTETVSLKAIYVDSSSPVWFAVGDTSAATTQDAYASLDKDGTVFGSESDMAYTYYTIAPMYLYDNLSNALNQATNSSCKGVVPMNSGTISGDYTIPAGVTLLIPFDRAHTMYTTVPGFIYSVDKGVENLYCSLTLMSGTNITVNGAISVSTAAHSADGGETAGYPCGDYSQLIMQKDSNITFNSGSALYAWGFITGDSTGAGTIKVMNGATVYESFQMAGHRGGNQSTSMKNNVFPISQYYVHNVEVPMTLEHGAVETCNTWINVSSWLYKDTQVPIAFIGPSGGLFNLTRGSVTKSYNGAVDRWELVIDGDVTVSPMSLSFGDDGAINSQNFVLGVNNNLTLKINSGTVTVGQDLALLPGSELFVGKDAKCVLDEGVSIYVYDGDTWGNYCYLSGSGDVPFIPVKFSPTRTYDRTAADLTDVNVLINGEVDASKGYLYTTAGGANIYSTGAGIVKMNLCKDTITYQLSQAAGTYPPISATSAKLTNRNGKQISTIAGTYIYDSYIGAWRCEVHTDLDTDHVCDSCGLPPCIDVNSKDHICDICGEKVLRIYATSITVADSLDMYFYIKTDDLIEGIVTDETVGQGYHALITRTYTGNDTEKKKEIKVSSENWSVKPYGGVQCVRFCYDNISAKEMTDTISVVIYNNDGKAVSEPYEESVALYAERTLDYYNDESDQTMRTALVDLLNYGAACQEYFDYNETNLATSLLSEGEKNEATKSDPDCKSKLKRSDTNSDYFVAASVSAKNRLMYTFYFENITPDMTSTVTYTDFKGNNINLTIPGTDFYYLESRGWYGVDVTGLSMVDGRQLLTCVVKDASGKVVTGGTDSVEGYVARAEGLNKPIFGMLMRFVDSAIAYSGSQSGTNM